MATATKSVTKAALSTFVRENTELKLIQSKALTDQLLDRYDISVKIPLDPSLMSIEIGQHWQHKTLKHVLLVTGVETGPLYVTDNPVTVWGETDIAWQDAERPSNTGVCGADPWREHMVPVDYPFAPAAASVLETPEESSTGS